MDTKGILKLLTNPAVLAAAAGGGTYYYRKKKADWITAAAAVGGLLGGYMLQKQLFPAPVLPPAQPQAQNGAGDFVDWQPTGAGAEHFRHQPISRGAHAAAVASHAADEAAATEQGSLTGDNGLGSYGGGYADDAELDAVMNELKRNGTGSN